MGRLVWCLVSFNLRENLLVEPDDHDAKHGRWYADSFLWPLFVAGLGSDLPECPDLEGLMMRDAISYVRLCECIIVGGGADVHESLHTRSHAHSPLLVRRHWPSRPFISEPYFQASWLHAPCLLLACWMTQGKCPPLS